MARDFQKEKHSLREKSVAMIEKQIEDQRVALQTQLDRAETGARKEQLHEKLGEQRKEYQNKLQILEEIKREKHK